MHEPDAIASIRRFNRFYTRRIGVLEETLAGSGFSLAETRVLWEIGHGEGATHAWLAGRLRIDAGYLSRIVRRLRERGLVATRASPADARTRHLEITARGCRALAPLEERSSAEVVTMLAPLGREQRARLVKAMAAIENLLEPDRGARTACVVREPRSGDHGWVIERHGALYAEEYGWDASFEAFVADIVARYLRTRDPSRERGWIAERDGERAGCVFVMRRSARVAQLRLLLVEPSARGLGIGAGLVDESVRFARAAGYRKIALWTNDVLRAARELYRRAGFALVRQEKHRSFGRDLVGQYWELGLQHR